MKQDERVTGIPDFVFCGVCLNARDVALTANGADGLVETCEDCGDAEYLLFGVEDSDVGAAIAE